jgi:hypothetical protein
LTIVGRAPPPLPASAEKRDGCIVERRLKAAPIVEAREKIRGDGFPGFDFDGLKGLGSGFDEGVDFVAFLVAEEMKRGFDASVGLGFERSLTHRMIFIV